MYVVPSNEQPCAPGLDALTGYCFVVPDGSVRKKRYSCMSGSGDLFHLSVTTGARCASPETEGLAAQTGGVGALLRERLLMVFEGGLFELATAVAVKTTDSLRVRVPLSGVLLHPDDGYNVLSHVNVYVAEFELNPLVFRTRQTEDEELEGLTSISIDFQDPNKGGADKLTCS